MTIWTPGMRCVCVEDRNGMFNHPAFRYAGDMDGLRRGQVYTVKDVVLGDHTGGTLLVLEEIKRKKPPSVSWENHTDGFHCARFRPLPETRLDQFRQHLVPQTDMPHYGNQKFDLPPVKVAS